MSWRSSSSTAAAPSAAASIPRSASPPSTSTLSARQAPWHSSSRKTSMSPASPTPTSLWLTAPRLLQLRQKMLLPPQKHLQRRKRAASTPPRSCPSRWPSPETATPWQRSASAPVRSSPPSTRRHATLSRQPSTPCSPSWRSSPC